jgi:predicted O-linked N-acetylglucosamine transferase (SPINDLY family)
METLDHAIDRFRGGNAMEAVATCERRLALLPDDVDTWSLLAEICAAAGSPERALSALEQVIARRPRDAAAHRRLASSLLALGHAGRAAEALHTAIAMEPFNARAHNNLGQALMQLDQNREAVASYREALRLEPRYAVAHNNLGLALTAAGEFDQARQAFEQALATAPQMHEAWIGRGVALANQCRWLSALECFDTALHLRPTDITAMMHKAMTLLSMERAHEALTIAEAALNIDSACAESHNARAGALRRLGRRSDAKQALEAALTINPTYLEAWCNQGTVLHEMGDHEAALAACRKALDLDPTGIQTRTRLLARVIPSVPSTVGDAVRGRIAFARQLLDIEEWQSARTLSDREAMLMAQQQFFYLTYQEQSNRGLLEKFRGPAAARLAGMDAIPRWQPSVAVEEDASAASGISAPQIAATQRFKLGIVSAQVQNHSVYNAIVSGWLQCLDRRQFDISVFSLGTREDAVTRTARPLVDHFESGVRPVLEWAHAIHDKQLDAVIYPELGMNETTLALASLRLASRQYAAWGHPETSGLCTVDGFLSAELFEPPDAQEHYTEKLVCLPNLGVYCQPYSAEPSKVDLGSLGLDSDCPMFICPGVPFKYRPQDDRIFVDIARRVGRCHFVFFQYEVPELSDKLLHRIALAFERENLDPDRYLRLIPWQPRAAFFGLLRHADVYLDTIGFSGFNTVMQAMECHLPCVTYEGKFMRGRLGSGVLKRLGLTECIAHTTEAYVNLAVRIAKNPAYRTEIRDRIRQAEGSLYADSSAVQALADHLLDSRISA